MNEFIEREALLKHLNECAKDEFFDSDMARAVVGISVYVEMMPTADVQPVKRGQWVDVEVGNKLLMKCSECGEHLVWLNFSYCPFCGADMRGEPNE